MNEILIWRRVFAFSSRLITHLRGLVLLDRIGGLTHPHSGEFCDGEHGVDNADDDVGVDGDNDDDDD